MKASRLAIFGSRLAAVLIAAGTFFLSSTSSAAVYLSVSLAPPVLPVYEQPLIPGPGYIWTPGYWAWGPDGFYWVPGTWVLAPYVGALWTPGYWAWLDGLYWWHPGYWGRHVGFYGGINYGYGYTGYGYHGGYWNRGVFAYNRAVNNVNVRTVRNVYNTTVVNNTTVTRVSYNGGSGGIVARPSAQDRIAERERHTPLLPVQSRHELAAQSNRALHASVNGGTPTLAATARPQAFRSASPSSSVRSFSQQAMVKPAAVQQPAVAKSTTTTQPPAVAKPAAAPPSARPRAEIANQNAGPRNERRLERHDAPVNANAPQIRGGPQARADARPAEPVQRSQGQIRREAPREARAPAQPPVQQRSQVQSQPQVRQQMPVHPQAPANPQAQMRQQAQPPAQGAPHRDGQPQKGRGREQQDRQNQ